MKMIMSAAAAAMLLAGLAAPASADKRVRSIVEEYVQVPSAEIGSYVKLRRLAPRRKELIADTLEPGTSEWWRQMDREQRGGRR